MLKRYAIVAAFVGSMIATPAMADPIVIGQWYTFGFGGVGSPLISGASFILGVNPASIAAPNAPWTFTLGGPGTLTVVDGFDSGDRFAMTDFGGAIGTTSLPVAGANCNNDITGCLANASISKGVFTLAAGNHSIGGTAVLSPFGGGAGFFQVANAAVPEPAAWAMMLAGVGAVGFAMRRRQRVTMRVAYAV